MDDADVQKARKFNPPELVLIHQAYVARVGAGRKCGADWLQSEMLERREATYTRTRLHELAKKFAAGRMPQDVCDSQGKGSGRPHAKLTDDIAGEIVKEITADRSNAGGNSLRELAKRHKLSKTTAARAVKKTMFKVAKKVKVPRTSTKLRQKRAEACKEFARMKQQGSVSATNLFFSDECFFPTHPTRRNAQNHRACVSEGDSKDEAAVLKQAPVPQRSA